MSLRPIDRPVRVAADLLAAVFENVDINLFDLYAASAAQGQGLIQNRTFRGCRLQGPVILLVTAGVTFDDTNFGESGGDIDNLVLRPVGRLALGTVPVRDCAFEGCEFYNVGFTGDDAFIALIQSVETQKS